MEAKNTDKGMRIMQATMELVAQQGLHGCPTSKIAEKAGVGMGTLYRYFENKDLLINETHRSVKSELNSLVFQDDAESLPVRERYLRIFNNLALYMIDHPNVFKFLEQYYNSPYGTSKKRELDSVEHRPFNDLLNHAKERQIIRNLENPVLFAFAFAPIMFMIKDHLAGFIKLSEEMIQQVVEASWDALKL